MNAAPTPLAQAYVREPCIGNDPRCPCQDGDPCHYRDHGDTKAMPTPRLAPTEAARCMAGIRADLGQLSQELGSTTGGRAALGRRPRKAMPSEFDQGFSAGLRLAADEAMSVISAQFDTLEPGKQPRLRAALERVEAVMRLRLGLLTGDVSPPPK